MTTSKVEYKNQQGKWLMNVSMLRLSYQNPETEKEYLPGDYSSSTKEQKNWQPKLDTCERIVRQIKMRYDWYCNIEKQSSMDDIL